MIPSFTHRFLMFPKEDSMPQESSALPLACSCRGGPWRPSDLPWCLLSTQDVKGCVGRSATIYDHLCIFVFKSGCSQPETLNPRHESATARRSTEDRYSNEIIECELRRFCCMTQKYTINNASFVAVNLWRRILGKPDHRRFTSFYSTKWPRRHERWGVESSCNSRSFRLSAWVPCPSHDMFASTDLSILWVTFSPGDFDKSLINFFFPVDGSNASRVCPTCFWDFPWLGTPRTQACWTSLLCQRYGAAVAKWHNSPRVRCFLSA